MTGALQAVRLPSAFAASLAIHIALGAALAAVAAGWQPGSATPAVKRDALIATIRAAKPAEASPKPTVTSRGKLGTQNAASVGAALPRPYYYPASELTERPLALAAIEPSFPIGAPATGRVKLHLYINEHGSVDAVDITDAEPTGEFEQAAEQAFRQARFRPGYKDGAAVRSQLALEVRFGEPSPPPARPLEQVARALPQNPNAWDAPDRVGIKTRRPQ